MSKTISAKCTKRPTNNTSRCWEEERDRLHRCSFCKHNSGRHIVPRALQRPRWIAFARKVTTSGRKVMSSASPTMIRKKGSVAQAMRPIRSPVIPSYCSDMASRWKQDRPMSRAAFERRELCTNWVA